MKTVSSQKLFAIVLFLMFGFLLTPEMLANKVGNNASVGNLSPNIEVNSDLRITVFHSPDSVRLDTGENIIYSIFVDNDGPSPATGVVVTNNLSPSLTFISATAAKGACTYALSIVTCNIGNLSGGTSITVIVKPNVPGLVTNTVNVSGNESDSAPFNNKKVETTLVNPAPGTISADLLLTVVAPANSLTINNIDYDVFVNNNGPSPATGVVVIDALPTNVTFISATASQGTCSFADGVVTCNLGTVTNNALINIKVRPTGAGTIVNSVSIVGNEPDFNPLNNTAISTSFIEFSLKARKQKRLL
jgi:uncharacterized repeat protein (TIGR01451 family)